MENKTKNEIFCLYTDAYNYPTSKILQGYLAKLGYKSELTPDDESDPDEIFWRVVCFFTTKEPIEDLKKILFDFGFEVKQYEFEVNDGRC